MVAAFAMDAASLRLESHGKFWDGGRWMRLSLRLCVGKRKLEVWIHVFFLFVCELFF